MKIERILHSLFIGAGCILILLSQLSYAEISPEEKVKVEQAVNFQTQVQPKKAHKILVMNLNMRDGVPTRLHKSVDSGNYALQLMSERTGAFEIVFSNDTLMFKKENLAQFDAICFNNTAGVLFTDPELRINLLDFISQGGGFIGIHAAAATFVQWPEYWQFPAFGQMVGAYEDSGHPWKPDETIYLQVDDPNHPLVKMFPKESFPIKDEVFQFRRPYSRDLLHVLLTIDTQKSDMSPERRFLPERFADRDFAISWIQPYGKGRVFYTSLGHNSDIFWNTPVLEHILAGIQYALGDLEADARPSALMSKP